MSVNLVQEEVDLHFAVLLLCGHVPSGVGVHLTRAKKSVTCGTTVSVTTMQAGNSVRIDSILNDLRSTFSILIRKSGLYD